ncbi:MAG: alkaline phosphatase family protein [Sulfuricaulis sp.]|nr:alkaline phosphatase family protein [Sulfuricaulis sp.]
MSFELRHTFVFERFTPSRRTSGEEAFFKVNEQGKFPVLFPGRLNRRALATFTHRVRVDPVGPESIDGEPPRPGSAPLHGGFQTVNKIIPLTLRIFTPDGREFTAAKITLADLRKFRDQRGSPSGPWSYSLTGESQPIFVDEDSSIVNAKGIVGLGVTETIASESAPPLVNNVPIIPTRLSFPFDLFRVGTFVAEISKLLIGAPWRGSMRLIDPDGVAVARTSRRKLTFAVGLPTLNKSRDAAGKVRKWTLEVSPQGGVIVGSPRVSATVIGSGRISIATLRSRIDALLGPRGRFIEIFGENKGDDALGRLRITDVVSAETIGMHGLLDGVLEGVEQDGDADPRNIQANTLYTLARKSESLKAGLKLEVKTLKVGTIDVVIGPGVRLGASVPTVRLRVAVSGAVKVKFAGATLATARVRGGKFDMEVGIKLGPDGTPQIVSGVPDSPFDIDISTAVKAALLATLGLAGLIGGMSVAEYIEHEINEAIVEGAQDLFSDPTIAPRILMTIFGAHLSYKSFRFQGEDIVFDHIAPVEPEPKPTPGYQGAIGRSFTQLTPNAVTFMPRLLGDTWRADNLTSKIDHIVAVMMENRSYDHVLGYRAQAPFSDGADGLTAEMIEAIEQAPKGPFDVRGLREAGFAKNAVKKMTRLPKGVGHEVHDVAEQLSVRAAGPGDRQINSPKGFVDNFKPRLKTDPQGVVPDDVLGFYDQEDLPFFDYLAKHYAYCDRYYCSHPGPTLPNRMYSLTGDLQHDRYGFPILDNNNSDNFLLSRVPTIYDFLARKGLSFRVYESHPSVTMLRMFARYATDNINIAPIAQLKADVAPGGRGLPAFTAIEPAMHHHPQNDDHPDADMHRGQIFLKDVYNTLRSNPALWEKTLLIITYDEHGGLYDHVVPPTADVYNVPGGPVLDPHGGGGPVVGGLGPRAPVGGGLSPARPIAAHAGGGAAVRGDVLVATPDPSPPPAPSLLQIPYGVRVPTFVVSPWTVRGKGPSLTLDHCSILKTVLARFLGNEKPFLSDRVSASHSFDAFLTEAAPRTVPKFDDKLLPGLPLGARRAPSRTTQIVTKPLSRKEMREGSVDYHELSGRWARQLGR